MTTAVRTWNKPRTKATITVTFDDGRTTTVGGDRARRAEAIIICSHPSDTEASPYVYGCRADLAAAQQEAHRLVNATTFRHHGHVLPRVPHTYAEAIPVVDAEQETQP